MPATTFRDTTKGTGSYATYYIWSLAANWINGIPSAGYDASYTSTVAGLDVQADDISSLTLNSLSLAATITSSEQLLVTGSLTLGALSLNGGTGGKMAFLVADAAITGSPATITVNGSISATGTAIVEAFGADASVFVNAADPGNMQYWAGSGLVINGQSPGLVYLQGAPAASSTFLFNGVGTFAFANPGASIASAFTGVGAGDVLELPGTRVLWVTYGSQSISVTTNAGVYNFTNVGFVGAALNDFNATTDFATGLDKVFLLSAPVLQNNSAATSSPYGGFFQWSNATNWSTSLVPASGADVALSSTQSNLLLDDLPNAAIGRLIFSSAGDTLTVNGALTISTVQFASAGFDTLTASTQFSGGATSATITINNTVSVNGGGGFNHDTIEAAGAGALVVVNGVDSGAGYFASNGGKIILNVTPTQPTTGVGAISGGTVVLASTGASVAGVTTLNMAMGIRGGSSIELPGSMLISSSTQGRFGEVLTTDDETYIFNEWYSINGFLAGTNDFIATRDLSNYMLKLTAEAAGGADNPQHNNDVDGDGDADIIFQSTSGETAVWNMNGVFITGSSFLPNPGGTWALITTGDFSGDGKSDFLFQDATGAVAEWLMNGDSVAAGLLLPNPGPTWKVEATGDFDRDGRSDIALEGSDGSVAIWEMNGGNIIANGAAIVANPGLAWKPVASGDFWGDGKTELVLQNTNGSLAFWGFNDSANGPVLDMTHTAQLSLNPGAAWQLQGTGDFNDDGMSDLAFVNSNTGQVAIWEMAQTGLLTPTSAATFAGHGAGWAMSQIGDFNGDGMSDFLFQYTPTGQLEQWTMNGLTISTLQGANADPGPAWHAIN